jgi:hypothetical protein
MRGLGDRRAGVGHAHFAEREEQREEIELHRISR